MVAVDAAVLCSTRGGQGHSYPILAFLESNAYSVVVRTLACAFWEEDSWSIHGCSGDEYATTVNGSYVQGGVPPSRWHISCIPLESQKPTEEVGQAGSIPTHDEPTFR
jgi:hypothetical protein